MRTQRLVRLAQLLEKLQATINVAASPPSESMRSFVSVLSR